MECIHVIVVILLNKTEKSSKKDSLCLCFRQQYTNDHTFDGISSLLKSKYSDLLRHLKKKKKVVMRTNRKPFNRNMLK